MVHASPVPASRAGSLPLVGSDLAFDLCNTASGRGTDALIDHLRGPEDVLAWALHAQVIGVDHAAALERRIVADAAFGADLVRRGQCLAGYDLSDR